MRITIECILATVLLVTGIVLALLFYWTIDNYPTTFGDFSIEYCNNRQSIVLDSTPPCDRLFAGDIDSICAWSRYSYSPNDTDNCRQLNHQVDTDDDSITLAFSLLVHTDVAHLAHLLHAIYTNRIIICIHIDAKSIDAMHSAIAQLIVDCFNSTTNIFILPRSRTVVWGGFDLLRAHLDCIAALLARNHQWQHVLTLSAHDYPLQPITHIVNYLQSIGNASDIEIIDELHRYKYTNVHRIVTNRHGHPNSIRRTDIIKSPPPAGMHIYKGNVAAALSRQLVAFSLNNQLSLSLLDWLRDTSSPDEHFYPTLIGNRILFADNDQQLFTVVSPYSIRYSLWKRYDRSASQCFGKFVRDVCIFGVGDLSHLKRRTELFVNKIELEYQSATGYCLEWLLKNRMI